MSDITPKTNIIARAWKSINSSMKAMDSLDAVEVVMAIEETFDVTIPDGDVEAMQTPRSVSNWLLPRVEVHAPNKSARRCLLKISMRDSRPDLVKDVGEPWNQEQVIAVLRNIIVEQTGAKDFTEDSTFKDDIFS
ncbi:MAG TPA: phosphopantetheine-binding protein [Terriglobales bacterium]|nr:phosphopantetheine-binding protein [Terriglobales bacterium]